MLPLYFNNIASGLDISERAFRLVQLKKINKKIKLASYNYISVPKGVIIEGKIVDEKKAIELINSLIKNIKGHKLSNRKINVCLPEQKTFIKLINLTYPEGKNILEEIVQEAKKHIPYSINEVYLDWQYVNAKDNSQILIGVCPKEIVDNYQDVLIKAELIPCSLEIEAVTLARTIFPFKEKITEPVMVLDLGAKRTGLFVYSENTIPFTISLGFSSDNLTEIISNQLMISLNESEEVKHKLGLNSDKAQGYSERIIGPEIKKLAQRIREANYFYSEHFQNQQEIKNLYLTGGGSYMPKLNNYLEKETKLKVHLTNPLMNISYDKIKLPENQESSYTTAIGLALKNLLIN